MPTITIFYGAKKPIKVTGRHCCNLFCFVFENQVWHSINYKDRNKRRAVASLHKRGYLEIVADHYRFKYPNDKTPTPTTNESSQQL